MQLKATYSDIWKVGYPIMLGNIAHGLTQAIDYAFMGHVGKNDLNGTLMGGFAFFLLVMVVLGFTRGAQIIMARRTGENNYEAVGKTFDHLLLKGVFLAVFFFAMVLFFKDVGLTYMLKSEEIATKASIYLSYRMWSVPLVVFNLSIIAFYAGIGKTKVITICTVIMSSTNVIFDYLLIFGHYGFPEMGIGGASLATVFAEIMGTVALVSALIINKDIKIFHLFKFPKTDWQLYGKMFNLSTPIVVQHILGLGTWWLFFLMVEKIGEEELAISGIIKSLYMLIGIPIWGFASAVNTIVSNVLGQKNIDDVGPVILKSIHISFVIAFALSAVIYIFPTFFLSMYSNDLALIQESIPTLKVVLFVMLIFSIGSMTMHGIMGIGDTKVMLTIEFVCIVAYVAYAYYSIYIWKMELPMIWMVEFVYWVLLGVLCSSYLATGRWKKDVLKV
jgi:putative MATE family efflux protein